MTKLKTSAINKMQIRKKEQIEADEKNAYNEKLMSQEKIQSTIRSHKMKLLEIANGDIEKAKAMLKWAFEKEEGLLVMPEFKK